MRLLHPDVLKIFLAMRRDDGLTDSQPSNKNLRYFQDSLGILQFLSLWIPIQIFSLILIRI